MSKYENVVVAYDFSPHAEAALYAGADLAKQVGAQLHLLHVFHQPASAYPALDMGGGIATLIPGEVRDAALKALEERASEVQIAPQTVSAHVIEGALIDRSIVEFCQQLGADMLVMGTHGRTGLAHVFLGSVAERTLRRAPCPVLTVQAPADSEENPPANG